MNDKNPTQMIVGMTYAPVYAYHYDLHGKPIANTAGCDHIELLIDGKRQMLRLTGIDAPGRENAHGRWLANWTARWLTGATLSVRCDRINDTHVQGHVWGTVTRLPDGACLNEDLTARMREVA